MKYSGLLRISCPARLKGKLEKREQSQTIQFKILANIVIREMQIGNMGRDDRLYMYEALVYQFQLMKPDCIKTKYLNNGLV